jgi:hypothetical protein
MTFDVGIVGFLQSSRFEGTDGFPYGSPIGKENLDLTHLQNLKSLGAAVTADESLGSGINYSLGRLDSRALSGIELLGIFDQGNITRIRVIN